MLVKQFPNIKNIECTSRCNLNCPICVLKTRDSGDIDFNLLLKILEKNCDFMVGQKIWLHYRGEPFLNKNIFQIINLFDKFKIKSRLSTNGILLLNQNIKKILDSKLEMMVISMITNNPVYYKKLRGADLYYSILKKVENLILMKKTLNSQLDIQVMGLDYGQSKNEINEFIDYFHNLGVCVGIHKYSTRLQESRYKPFDIKEVVRQPCHWPFNNTVILYNGDITTCYFDLNGRGVIDNLKNYNYSILDLWNSTKYKHIRANHLKYKFKGHCEHCTDWIYNNSNSKLEVIRMMTIYPLKGIPYDT